MPAPHPLVWGLPQVIVVLVPTCVQDPSNTKICLAYSYNHSFGHDLHMDVGLSSY